MKNEGKFDVIIIGGSYAGLSAAMALGRSLRKVLIIDGGKPCNRQTPHSHNFITHDGETPANISRKAKEQVLNYPTVNSITDQVLQVEGENNDFTIRTQSGGFYQGAKLIFATGMKDDFPAIPGFSDCWGISVLHCPYCHGYEVRHEKIAIISNGSDAFEMVKLISNWSPKLTLITNGSSTLSEDQALKLQELAILVIEKEIKEITHENGYVKDIVFSDNSSHETVAIFARPKISQHDTLPQQLSCELTESGLIKVDDFQRTTVAGVYAAGDCASLFRSVPSAVAAGNKAGALVNKELIDEYFWKN
ncbi:Thioredoxin reductase [compost metagenome]